MNKDAIAAIFNDPEDQLAPVLQAFQDFVELIPPTEGVLEVTFKPETLNLEVSGKICYKASLVWDMGKDLGGTTLFRVHFNPEYGFPLVTQCLDTRGISEEKMLQSGLERFAEEVKASLRAQVSLWKAGNLSAKYLGRKPGEPEPTIMIQVGGGDD